MEGPSISVDEMMQNMFRFSDHHQHHSSEFQEINTPTYYALPFNTKLQSSSSNVFYTRHSLELIKTHIMEQLDVFPDVVHKFINTECKFDILHFNGIDNHCRMTIQVYVVDTIHHALVFSLLEGGGGGGESQFFHTTMIHFEGLCDDICTPMDLQDLKYNGDAVEKTFVIDPADEDPEKDEDNDPREASKTFLFSQAQSLEDSVRLACRIYSENSFDEVERDDVTVIHNLMNVVIQSADSFEEWATQEGWTFQYAVRALLKMSEIQSFAEEIIHQEHSAEFLDVIYRLGNLQLYPFHFSISFTDCQKLYDNLIRYNGQQIMDIIV